MWNLAHGVCILSEKQKRNLVRNRQLLTVLKEKDTSLALKKHLLATYPKLTHLIVELSLLSLERAITLDSALGSSSKRKKPKHKVK